MTVALMQVVNQMTRYLETVPGEKHWAINTSCSQIHLVIVQKWLCAWGGVGNREEM